MKLFKLSISVLILGLIAILLVIFIPRNYDVPAQTFRKGTQFWNLQTGSKIAYTLIPSIGNKQAFPIIFLQGGPGGFISDRNIQILKPLSEDGYDIYLYDQIGSGLSERLSNIKDYTTKRHENDLAEIIETIAAEKVILIGQSWGASLAGLYLANHPNKVAKLILTGPGPILPLPNNIQQILAPDSLNLKKPQFSNKEANEKVIDLRIKLLTFFAQNFGIKLASDEEMDAFQTYLNGELNKAIVCDTSRALQAEAGGGFYAQVMTLKSFNETQNVRPKINGINIPLLLMKGQCDAMPWAYMKEYMDLFPNHILRIIPEAGHSISVEQPELYRKYIREFLKE